MAMKEQAETALINAAGSGQGAIVTAPRNVIQWLRECGLIGEGNGLTRNGATTRATLVSAALDRAFG